MEKIREELISSNTIFQSIFLSTYNSKYLTKAVKRYTDARVLASKMNNLLIQLMKQYISKLINLLVEAGVIRKENGNK